MVQVKGEEPSVDLILRVYFNEYELKIRYLTLLFTTHEKGPNRVYLEGPH